MRFGKKPAAEAVAEPVITDNAQQSQAENEPSRGAGPERRIPTVSIQNLRKAYGSKQVLKGLDLEVYEGELFGFLGKNGIGKSTTIDCVIGSKKFDSGRIILNGYDIKHEPIEAKYSFGYVASEPACYEVMTGYDYLEFVASVYGISEGEFVQNARYLCSRLSLDEAELSHRVCDYSHGMKQKLCLVASLLHSPKIWILDEPTVGLDIMAIEELKKMMREYANHQKTVFVTSHNIELVANLCDRVAIINEGKVAALYDLNKQPTRRIQLSKIFMDTYRSN